MAADWHRPIFFEGVELPRVAIAIDHLGSHGNLPEMSEATSLWLWRFTICVGCPRTDNSLTVLHHARGTLELTQGFRDRLIQTVPQHYDNSFEPSVIDAWIDTLHTIIQIAGSRESCTWEAPLRPGDDAYGRPPGEVLREMWDGLNKATDRQQQGDG